VVEHQTRKSGGVKWPSEDQLREFISVEILDRRSPARTVASECVCHSSFGKGRDWVEHTFGVVSCTLSRMRIVVPPKSDVVSVDILRTDRRWLRYETQLWL
jgi:hypothetical protein